MNSFGRIFRVSIFGESHGSITGVLIDGCPPGIPINRNSFNKDIKRRRPGAYGTTTRFENDIPTVETGVYMGKTTGAPILLYFENANVESSAYNNFIDIPRPGHADYTANLKYNTFNDPRGSGHFSGRITLGLVVAGVIAKKIIAPANVNAKLLSVGGSKHIKDAVKLAVESGDSIGGLIECTINNIDAGLGEPFFDSIESYISHIIFSIPAIKGIEFGAGFKSSEMKGSEMNDAIINNAGTTKTNNAGGINGGISNGNPIIFRVAVKPPSSISLAQETYNFNKNMMDTLEVKGRHDACIALRMPVIVEAAAAIALADLKLVNTVYHQ